MGKLIITEAEGGSRDLALTKERTTIGRHAENDICFNDKAVSGRHAVIITILNDSFLEDLKSTNGTQVNGRQISKHALVNGETISIGRNTLKFEGEAAKDDEDFEKTMILRPSQVSAAFASQASQLAGAEPAAAAKPLTGRLRVASGPNMGKELELTKALTTIGRPGVQVAAITRRADGFYIVHVGGAEGGARPLVNKIEVDTQARKLSDGDIIELVGTQMTFRLGQ